MRLPFVVFELCLHVSIAGGVAHPLSSWVEVRASSCDISLCQDEGVKGEGKGSTHREGPTMSRQDVQHVTRVHASLSLPRFPIANKNSSFISACCCLQVVLWIVHASMRGSPTAIRQMELSGLRSSSHRL